jgi:hypothetical protein
VTVGALVANPPRGGSVSPDVCGALAALGFSPSDVTDVAVPADPGAPVFGKSPLGGSVRVLDAVSVTAPARRVTMGRLVAVADVPARGARRGGFA